MGAWSSGRVVSGVIRESVNLACACASQRADLPPTRPQSRMPSSQRATPRSRARQPRSVRTMSLSLDRFRAIGSLPAGFDMRISYARLVANELRVCPICHVPCNSERDADRWRCTCDRCGDYWISGTILAELQKLTEGNREIQAVLVELLEPPTTIACQVACVSAVA